MRRQPAENAKYFNIYIMYFRKHSILKSSNDYNHDKITD